MTLTWPFDPNAAPADSFESCMPFDRWRRLLCRRPVNNRVQVWKMGVGRRRFTSGTLRVGSAWTWSTPDPDQLFLCVADGTNQQI
jgi:hypothetical protein